MDQSFEMVAKTFQGLEDVLAEELRNLGATNVEPGRRMVSFQGDKAMLYRANMCLRTALRVLKPIYKFVASDPDRLYECIKEFNWSTVISLDKTFSIDTVTNSDDFTHSRYVTYRCKDGIVDYFRDRFGPDTRPRVRLQDADVRINVHIRGDQVTVSLDSSGESLHRRGYRVAQTEAPINEVLAAGIILKSGWRGDAPFVDPMCGSGTFLIEAALIGTGINPGVFRRHFAFEAWPDFDGELFDQIYNDDSAERTLTQPIIGADISPKAVDIALANIKSAGVARYIDLKVRPISQWTEAPHGEGAVLITNPPYGERISSDDMDGLYSTIGTKLKQVFQGYHAWIIGYREEYFHRIGLTPSLKQPILNGALECQLREYVIFEGDYQSFRANGGSLRAHHTNRQSAKPNIKHKTDSKFAAEARREGLGGNQRLGRNERNERPNRSKTAKFAGRSTLDRFETNKPVDAESENPLAGRRNAKALRSIVGRTPSLKPDQATQGRQMRPRRGWKRPFGNTDNDIKNDN